MQNKASRFADREEDHGSRVRQGKEKRREEKRRGERIEQSKRTEGKEDFPSCVLVFDLTM